MSPYYDQPGYRRTGPEDVVGVVVLLGCAVFGFLWYIAVSRLHLHNDQCLEIFLDCAIVFFGGGVLIAHFAGRRQKREENWPHPAVTIPALKDARIVHDAHQDAATLLGYNVHKEPWLWPDAVRIKHGVIVGGTGAGKSTFLENIIAQDLTRRFGARKMPSALRKSDPVVLGRSYPDQEQHWERQGYIKHHPAPQVRLGFVFSVSSHAEGVALACALHAVSG